MATKLKNKLYSNGSKKIQAIITVVCITLIAVSLTGIMNILAFLIPNAFYSGEYEDEGCQELSNVILNLYYIDNTPTDIAEYRETYEEMIETGYYAYAVIDSDVWEVFKDMEEIISDPDYANYSYGYDYDIVSTLDDRPTVEYPYSINDDYFYVFVTLTDKGMENASTVNGFSVEDGKNAIFIIISCFIILLINLIISMITAGKTSKDSEVTLKWWDKIYSDIFLFLTANVVGWLCFAGILLFLYYFWNQLVISEIMLKWFIAGIAFVIAVFIHWYITTFVKRIKTKTFLKHTLVFVVINKVYNFAKKYLKKAFGITRKFFKRAKEITIDPISQFTNKDLCQYIIICAAVLGVIFTGLTILFGGILWYYSAGMMISCVVILYAVITYLVVRLLLIKLKELEEIKKGAELIRGGDLQYKIPELKNKELNNIADNLNNIGMGLEAAVHTATVSEKMKSQLVTNVSHDLKTPLTSIIGYLDLLDKDESLSAESRDYVNVLQQKSQRLSSIISDLFDLSKGNSGELSIEMEVLDFKRLVQQTMGDMSDKIAQSGQNFREQYPETELMITGDGRRIYRVVQNIIDNAVKYSLLGTRIFVKVYARDGMGVLEVKNTAGYEMEFDEEEIRQRFTRGDKSRSTEGTGLGLSIAESFTTLCGGNFGIQVDGDQFKTVISFPIN